MLPVSPSSSSGPESWPHGRGTFSKSAVACVLLKLRNQTPSLTANRPPPTAAPVSGLTSEAAGRGEGWGLGGVGKAAEKEELGVGGLEPMLVIAERSVLTPTQGRET